jgi:hypothetical protein
MFEGQQGREKDRKVEKRQITFSFNFSGSCFQDGINFAAGSTLSTTSLDSALLCQYQCQINSACVRFFYNKSNKLCYITALLYGTVYIDAVVVSGPKYCTGNVSSIQLKEKSKRKFSRSGVHHFN